MPNTAASEPQPPRCTPTRCEAPFERITYDEAFRRTLGTGGLALSAWQLRELAARQGIRPPESLRQDDRDGWLNLLLGACVEPTLGVDRPVFVYDYPPTQAALARIRPGAVPVAERFELYIAGVEICNGYQELTDPEELRRRLAEQSALRCASGSRPLPCHSRLLRAMQAGLPGASGVALGVDRLAMVLWGADCLQQVMSFPIQRA